MEGSVWRTRASLRLRIVAGVLTCLLIWPLLALLSYRALHPSVFESHITQTLIFLFSAFISWLAARRFSAGVARILSIVAPVILVVAIGGGLWYNRSVANRIRQEAAAQASQARAEAEKAVKAANQSPVQRRFPQFPWPPPYASASYELPDSLFKNYRTVGDVVSAILSALERNGYVERSFFRTEADGVALVTRLERIKDDGSSFPASERWSDWHTQSNNLVDLLRGLFFVDAGHYRIIVFVLQDLPFSQSPRKSTGAEAEAWLRTGANSLPPEVRDLPFGDARCTVLVYEFASDGTAAQLVVSRLTGLQHLEKSGILSLLQNPK